MPEEFRKAVERHLKTQVPSALKHYVRKREAVRDEDPYRPYDGIDDTLRNRLLMFIAKWSPEALASRREERDHAEAGVSSGRPFLGEVGDIGSRESTGEGNPACRS